MIKVPHVLPPVGHRATHLSIFPESLKGKCSDDRKDNPNRFLLTPNEKNDMFTERFSEIMGDVLLDVPQDDANILLLIENFLRN